MRYSYEEFPGSQLHAVVVIRLGLELSGKVEVLPDGEG